MFTPLLFDHKFDIDDIIRALCGDDHQGRWLLSTRDGTLVKEEENSPTASLKDGDDDNHLHVIEPLPFSFFTALQNHHQWEDLSEEEQTEASNLINNNNLVFEFINVSDETRTTAWFRERVKNAAMEWLDDRGLIPPSMRHIKDVDSTPPAYAGKKVKINLS